MATRYLIGTGNRNWNDTANWAETSGGAGGASVPTEADDVVFDSNSGTGTVTVNAIANMRDCTFAQTQLITLANAAYAFNIFGNWTLCDNAYLNTSFTGTGYVYLKATTSVNITSNGCTRAWNILYFDGVGGTWINQDDMNVGTSTINFLNGNWNTNNKTIATQEKITFGGENSISINLGSSFLYAGSWVSFVNLTIDSGASTIIITKDSASLQANGTFNIVKFINIYFLNIGGTLDINYMEINYMAANHVTNLFRIPISFTVNNEIKITGGSSIRNRILLYSDAIGTPRTITCNGTITASNVDFRDIVGAGSANWDLSAITGGSGDCGGNSGITFTPAQTQYFKHTLGAVNWSDATKWFSNYERTIAGRVPLPQDNAIFDENSFTGASTLTINVPRLGGLLINSINQSLAVVLANSLLVFLNFKLGAAVLSGNYLVEFDGHNRTFASPVYLGISNSAPNNFTVLGNNTFAELILEPDRKIKFTAGTTQTVSKLKALGTPTNPIKIDSTSASRFNLVKIGSEPNECNFIDISNSNASPSGSWPAGYNSNDMGNNAGWEFNTDDFVPQIINF